MSDLPMFGLPEQGAGAVLSEDGRYRYLLTRRWSDNDRLATFVMLNPSTADATTDDPTIRRCISFAKREGCGHLQVVNLFAFRATDPRELRDAVDPVGPENNEHIRHALWRPGVRIAAWGAYSAPQRVVQVLSMAGGFLRALGVTREGHPRHPLYVKADAPLIPWPVVS